MNNFTNVIVKYRYTIPMPDRYKSYNKVLYDWTNTKFKTLYTGHIGLLVCPYFFVKGKDYIYCQVLIDVEGKPNTKTAYEYAYKLRAKYPWLTVEYTGKSGFHLASNFLVKIQKDETPVIRSKILDPLNLDYSIVDKTSSIRSMPTIRIGKVSKDRFAFPVLSEWNYEEFEKHRYDKSFESILAPEQLKAYIEEFILPNKIISYKQYLNLT